MIQKELIGDLKLKWDRMQQAMQKINADGCLLTVDVNLYYTTGRIYSGGRCSLVLRETAERAGRRSCGIYPQTGTNG